MYLHIFFILLDPQEKNLFSNDVSNLDSYASKLCNNSIHFWWKSIKWFLNARETLRRCRPERKIHDSCSPFQPCPPSIPSPPSTVEEDQSTLIVIVAEDRSTPIAIVEEDQSMAMGTTMQLRDPVAALSRAPQLQLSRGVAAPRSMVRLAATRLPPLCLHSLRSTTVWHPQRRRAGAVRCEAQESTATGGPFFFFLFNGVRILFGSPV